MTRTQWLSMSLLAAIAAGALASASDAAEVPKRGGTLNVATNQSVDALDAYTTSTTLVRTMHYHTHGQLYTYDSTYDLIPELADGYDVSPDGRAWTFKIRSGIRFHDGSSLDAGDVVASWERFVAVSPGAPTIARAVSRVHATDDRTVVFEFKEDPGPFLSQLSAPHIGFKIYPAEISKAAAKRPLEFKEMIGTGPYRFAEWRRGQALVMERFDQYTPDDRHQGPNGLGGKRTAYLDRIVWNFAPEPGAQAAGLQSGRFDLADAVPVESRAAIEAKPGFSGTVIKPYAWINTMVNHHNPPLDDLKVRRAIQVGVDQQLVMLAAIGDPALIRLSPGIAFEEQVWFSKAGSEYYNRADKEMARRLLKEAGYAGQEIVLMTTRTQDFLYKSAVVLQQELQSLGINARLEVLDWAALLGHITNKELWRKWHLSSMFHSLRHDPAGWDRNFRSDRWTPYASKAMDAALDKVARERDQQARSAAFAEVQRLFHEDVVNIKNGDFFIWHAHKADVKGYTGFEGYIFWNVWLDR